MGEIETYILYDNRNIEIYELLIKELERQSITKYHIKNPILSSSVFKSISISQKAIIKEAKERSLKEVCLMEEDVWFPAADGWQYFLRNKPKEFDIYLGGSYLIDNLVTYQNPVTKVDSYVGHHCIIVSERYYDTFLATTEEGHIDTEQSNRGEFYLCYPMAALQRPSKSANNNNAMSNYNSLFKNTNIEIYGNPFH